MNLPFLIKVHLPDSAAGNLAISSIDSIIQKKGGHCKNAVLAF
jgi:hypothetical protein